MFLATGSSRQPGNPRARSGTLRHRVLGFLGSHRLTGSRERRHTSNGGSLGRKGPDCRCLVPSNQSARKNGHQCRRECDRHSRRCQTHGGAFSAESWLARPQVESMERLYVTRRNDTVALTKPGFWKLIRLEVEYEFTARIHFD
jgi:hypothetical protein